jgi:acetyl-CoA carboxylase alpha subunit
MLMLPTLAKQIEKKIKETKENIYKILPWQRVQLSRHQNVYTGVCRRFAE